MNLKNKYNPFNVMLITLLMTWMVIPTAAKSTFSGEKLRKACMDYIYKAVGQDAEISIPQNIKDVEFEDDGIKARCTGSAESLRGNTYLAVEFIQDGKLVRRIEVPVRIKIYGTVPVLNKSMAKGSVIGSRDINLEKRDLTHIAADDIATPEETDGLRVKRSLSAGTVITRSMLESGVYIRSGDRVDIVVESGAVRIRTSGVALQDAASGNKIRVKREGTQTVLQGEVAMDGSVLIKA